MSKCFVLTILFLNSFLVFAINPDGDCIECERISDKRKAEIKKYVFKICPECNKGFKRIDSKQPWHKYARDVYYMTLLEGDKGKVLMSYENFLYNAISQASNAELKNKDKEVASCRSDLDYYVGVDQQVSDQIVKKVNSHYEETGQKSKTRKASKR